MPRTIVVVPRGGRSTSVVIPIFTRSVVVVVVHVNFYARASAEDMIQSAARRFSDQAARFGIEVEKGDGLRCDASM